MENEDYLNRSLLRALSIVELLGKEARPLGVGEISRLSGLSKSTVHRLLQTLQSRGWLNRIDANGKYRLGIKLATLSSFAYEGLASSKEIRPFLQDLSTSTNETVVLSMWDGNEVVCIDKIEGSQRISITSKIGQYFPVHAGASGFAVLASMPFDMFNKVISLKKLEIFTSKTISDQRKLIERYFESQKMGYVVSSGEKDVGVTSVAVGLYFPYEQECASFAVVLPDSRATDDFMKFVIKEVLETKTKINAHLDFVTKNQ